MLKGSGARYGWSLSSVLAGDHPGLPCHRWETGRIEKNRASTAPGFPGLEHSPPPPSDRYAG